MHPFKKVFSILLVTIIIFSLLIISPIMASALTNQEGAIWALNRIGQSIDTDGLYGAQCKDFVNAFTQENFGVTFPGNANALIYTSLPAGWQRIANTPDFIPEPGDIALWDSWSGNPYGHTAIIVSANLNTFVSIDQNWINSSSNGSPAAKVTHNYTNPKFWGVLRPPYNSNENVPHEDLGTNFYAVIFNTKLWKPITVSENNNVVLKSENWKPNQAWKFERQYDGSYIITSAFNGYCLDLKDGSPADQTNIGTWSYNGCDAQKWYITAKDNGYQFRAKCTDCVMEMNAPNFFEGVNVAAGINHGVPAEIFTINKVSWDEISLSDLNIEVYATDVKFTWSSKQGITGYNIKVWNRIKDSEEADYNYWNVKNNLFTTVLPPGEYEAVIQTYNAINQYNQSGPIKFKIDDYIDIGDEFYGIILNTNIWKPIGVDNDNVTLQTENGTADQLWKIKKQSDFSYKIYSTRSGKCLDLLDSKTDNGTELHINVSSDSDTQKWYFKRAKEGFNIISKSSLNKVIDLKDGNIKDGAQVQLFDWNGNDAQIFSVYSSADVQLAPASLSVIPGTNNKETVFSWSSTYGESTYDLKIWNESDSEWVKDITNIAQNTNNINVLIPNGNYKAFLIAKNIFESKKSNVVSFTVEKSTLVLDDN